MPRTPHDEIVSSLLDVLSPLNGEIRLLGRVSDPVIGNPSEREVFLFIPDLHVLSPHRRERFKYGFNHSESGLLAKLLERIATLRNAWEENRNTKLVTVQLGDFFDLCLEGTIAATPLSYLIDHIHRDIERPGLSFDLGGQKMSGVFPGFFSGTPAVGVAASSLDFRK